MTERLKSILQCSNCGGSFEYQEQKIECQKCNSTYELTKGIPVFLGGNLPRNSGAPSKFFKKFSSMFFYTNTVPINVINSLLKKYEGKTVLNLGSGDTAYDDSINVDIGLFENVNLVADAHSLPIKDSVVDLIISCNVLEHLKNPQKAIDEFHRILKKNGSVFIEVPFIQRFHGYPDDYFRFTLLGLRQMASKFSHVSSGVAGGPVAAITELTINFLRFAVGNNKLLLLPLFSIFLPFFFILKYFDGYLLKRKDAYKLSSSIYFVGKK